MYDLQLQLGRLLAEMTEESEYLLDSFPVAVCDHIRITGCRLLQGEEYRGWLASKRRYLYGIRIHLLATASGIPVEWIFLPGSAHDTRGLFSLAFNLPVGSEIYADKGYTDYLVEDCLSETDALALMALRKQRSTRPDSPPLAYVKRTTRHYIETVFSRITSLFPKVIHTVTFDGFLLKFPALSGLTRFSEPFCN